MYSVFVALDVKADYVNDFIQASITEGQGVLSKEEACFRFDILRDSEKPNRFHIYKVFRDESAAEAHRQTQNFKRWEQAVDGMVEGKRGETIRVQTVYPSERDLELHKLS